MRRLELERPTLERFYQEDYDALAADLEELGWTLVEEPRVEERSLDLVTGIEVSALWVVLRVVDTVADSVIDELLEAVRKRLRRPRDKNQLPRVGVIYGQYGERLREVSLDSDDDEPKPPIAPRAS